jgi:hypothetical protein
MTALLMVTLLATALYGDDNFTAILNSVGYDVQERPCGSGSEAGTVAKVAIFADGTVKLNGATKNPAEVATFFDQNWVQIRSYCLYIEGPWSKLESDAYHQIMSGVMRHDYGVSRFTDPEFTKRAIPRLYKLPKVK